MITLILRFVEDEDDSFRHRESEALLVETVPHRGETITIGHNFHPVVNVIHNYDADGVEVHVGPARDTPEEALQWLVENCDFVVALEPVMTPTAGGETPQEPSED